MSDGENTFDQSILWKEVNSRERRTDFIYCSSVDRRTTRKWILRQKSTIYIVSNFWMPLKKSKPCSDRVQLELMSSVRSSASQFDAGNVLYASFALCCHFEMRCHDFWHNAFSVRLNCPTFLVMVSFDCNNSSAVVKWGYPLVNGWTSVHHGHLGVR